MNKERLKEILISNQREVENYDVMPRLLQHGDYPRQIFVGLRRAGKSFMLYQKMQERLQNGARWDTMLYLNFEDDRLENFTSQDFNLILECHLEIYGQRPILFLDEIQNIEGWEKFARRLADTKYEVWITGSNAKMLSNEIMTTLGARYLSQEIYPFDFQEFLKFRGVKYSPSSFYSLEEKAQIRKNWEEYLLWGGLPESVSLSVKRNYLTSLFQKIYLGDIVSRNNIPNHNNLRLLVKKLAENVMQPVSYNRLASILSTINGKISMPTVSRYIDFCEEAWLLLRLRNISAPFAEREMACKYYFIDNGILNLFLVDGVTALFENLVALALFKRYGYDKDNERIFFYKKNVEVDFYIPDEGIAIQACYSLSNSEKTLDREIEALTKINRVLECKRRMILTVDEEKVIKDEFGEIEIIPLWKWLL